MEKKRKVQPTFQQQQHQQQRRLSTEWTGLLPKTCRQQQHLSTKTIRQQVQSKIPPSCRGSLPSLLFRSHQQFRRNSKYFYSWSCWCWFCSNSDVGTYFCLRATFRLNLHHVGQISVKKAHSKLKNRLSRAGGAPTLPLPVLIDQKWAIIKSSSWYKYSSIFLKSSNENDVL